MKIFYLIIDESGAKGYSDNNEKFVQEFGLMVGFLVPEEHLKQWREQSDYYFKINNTLHMDEKIHITSLKAEEQERFRETLNQIFLYSGVNWYYQATYVQGFNEGNSDKESLHSKLFAMIFSKALYNLTLLKENGDLKIHIISDILNKGEIKLFKREIQDLISIFTNKNIEKDLVIFDKKTKNLIRAKSISKLDKKDKNFPEFKSIDLDISIEDSNLTLMADILANSVFHHLNKYLKDKNNYPSLNSRQAIKNHPLDKLVLGSPDEDQQNCLPNIYDIMYRKR